MVRIRIAQLPVGQHVHGSAVFVAGQAGEDDVGCAEYLLGGGHRGRALCGCRWELGQNGLMDLHLTGRLPPARPAWP
jgi:hypothetical protein